ncbi:hypothetical protein LXL04_000333 [Taraxacum kok-saghyz]
MSDKSCQRVFHMLHLPEDWVARVYKAFFLLEKAVCLQAFGISVIMDGWRDQGVNYNQEITRTRPNCYRKPPIGGNPNWQQSVPSWEKKFCSSIGSIPWKKLVETKRFIHLYDNVIKWNDSAGKEAFQTAKNKFYANIHGLPFNNRLPDPDIYIDNIDWDSEVDPTLILDLDSDSVVPDSGSKEEQVVIFGSSFPPSYQSFSPYGWGDSDDDDKKKDPNTSPEQNINTGGVVDNSNSWWGWSENEEKVKGNEEYRGWNMYDDNNCFYGDMSNGNMSRYKTSRFVRTQSRRNTGRRAVNHGGSPVGYGCVPVSQGGAPGGGGHRWSVKKTVS